MSTLHTATLPDGSTAKRTSANHVYSPVVPLGPEARADVVERYQRDLAREQIQAAYYRVVIDYVNGGGELVKKAAAGSAIEFVHASGMPGLDPYRGLGWCDRSGQFLMTEGDTLAEQVTTWFRQLLASNQSDAIRARIAETEAGPEWIGTWSAVAWASRAGLGESAAGKYRSPGRGVQILTTERSTK